MIKVSIIIPVYNGERYVRKAIDSALVQTLKDIEIICVNDGSTDSTAAILGECAALDGRIRLIHRSAEGVSSARNAGIEVARGEFIEFLDADDELGPEVCERLVEKAEAGNCDVVQCGHCEVRDGEISRTSMPSSKCVAVSVRDVPEILSAQTKYIWDKLFRVEMLRRANIRFAPLGYHEDHLFLFDVALVAKNFDAIPYVGYRYSKSSEGAATRSYDERLLDCTKAYREICDKARKAGLFETLAPFIWRNCSQSYAWRVNAFGNYDNVELQRRIVEEWDAFFSANFPRWQKNMHLAGLPVVLPKRDGVLKVLLLGGTGALGAHLRDLLASAGHSVFVTSRSDHDDAEGICYLKGDAHDVAFFNRLMVSHWDAIVDFMVYSPDVLRQRLDVLLKATDQYVFLSSSRVYADLDMTPIHESSPRIVDTVKDAEYLKTSEYALSKGRSEDMLFAHPRKNWTIIRPYITFSEQRLQLGTLEKENWLARALDGKPIVFSRDIAEKTTTLTYGRDVARGMAAIIGKADAYGQAFHITGERQVKWGDVLDMYVRVIEEVTKRPCKVVMTEESCQLKTTGKYQVLFDRRYNRIFDNSKIGRYVDVSTFLEPMVALEGCLRAFLAKPAFLAINQELAKLHDEACGISGLRSAKKPAYTVERNVQILIAALKAHGIRQVVASPGTTNLTFVASLQYDGGFTMYSAPDERSAAYMACGLAAESGQPVVITCTGATASRNYLPGLTEAYYRKLPILAVTGTLYEPRSGHLTAQFVDRSSQPTDTVRLSVSMPSVRSGEDEWHNTVAANRAILELRRHGGGPVHINLETGHSSDYSVLTLPPVRVIRRFPTEKGLPPVPAGRIGIFVGAHVPWSSELTAAVDRFCEKYDAVVFCDHASNYRGRYGVNFTLACYQQSRSYEALRPDLLIHIGEVSGDYPSFKICGRAQVWRVSPDGEIRDAFRRLTGVFEMCERDFFEYYVARGPGRTGTYRLDCRAQAARLLDRIPELPLSNIWIAQQGSRSIPEGSVIHFGILNSFRSWSLWPLPQSVVASCNTGGFGIDGCLSTAVGASLANPDRLHFVALGDLAFFYDMNVAGNRHVGNNLRILLVNNGKGVEFRNFNHPAAQFGDGADKYIAAGGHYGRKSATLVRHYAEDLGFAYMSATTKSEYLNVAKRFWSPEPADRPMILEVFTDSADDSNALERMTLIEGSVPVPVPPPAPMPQAVANAQSAAVPFVRAVVKSRKIAILTFHAAFNCGARLQAWALQVVLRRLGFDPEFPDCNSIGFTKRFDANRNKGLTRWQAFVRELKAFGVEDVKRHRFRMFDKRCLNIVPIAPSEINRRYPALLVGSDQVWNSGITRQDSSYFLTTRFSKPGLLRYSYAISLGDKTPPPARVPVLLNAAHRFENVSVRENLLPDLMDKFGRRPMVDPDPTLLLTKEDFNTIAYRKRLVKGPYLLVYSLLHNAETWAAARLMAKKLNLKLVIVQCYQYGHYRQKEGRGVHIAASPDRFLAYFRDASAVITSSFHGTAFSIIYGKPFAVVPNHEYKPPLRSVTLLKKLHEDFRVAESARFVDVIENALKRPPAPSVYVALSRLRAETVKRMRATLPDISNAAPIVDDAAKAKLPFPVRKIIGGIKCVQENGLRYTVRHTFGKILGLAGVRTRL